MKIHQLYSFSDLSPLFWVLSISTEILSEPVNFYQKGLLEFWLFEISLKRITILILSSDPQNLKYLLSSTFRSLLLSTLEPQKIEGAKLD